MARLIDIDGDRIFVEVGENRAQISIERAEQDGAEFVMTLHESWGEDPLTLHFTGPDQYCAVISFKALPWRYYKKRVEE